MKKLCIALLISLCIILPSCAPQPAPIENKQEESIKTEIIETPVSVEKVEEIITPVTSMEEEIKEAVYTPETITISFAGDFILGSFLGQGGITFHDYFDDNGYTWPLEGVKEVFLNDDITFINLECALTNQIQTAEKEFAIKGKPEYAQCLDYGGVDVVTIANNHIYDCAREVGIRDTVENLSQFDIGVCGEGYEYYTTVKGASFCFLGYRTFLVNDALKNQVARDIENAREIGTDIVIVEFHGGTEKEYYSDPDQEEINRFAIDNGADIVLSSHPHVIQGFETYNGKIIAHGLGNFVFGTNGHPKDRDTYIFQQEFIFDAEEGTVSYGESNIIPCSVSSDPSRNNYQPMIYEKDSEDYNRVLSRLKEYSSPYDYSLPILDLGGY